MLDYAEFVLKKKSMLIAPAGFGKTYTIAECLKYTNEMGKQLVLTHTHAGVASLKEKISKRKLGRSECVVETITSFAQRYTTSFYVGDDVPKQENSAQYYSFVVSKAAEIVRRIPVQQVILATYGGLFVDEYQDCTKVHHDLILALSELLPTHIMGDFLQGIFDFTGEALVRMEDATDMGEFVDAKYELDEPQRWMNGNNAALGRDLKLIRDKLIARDDIELAHYTSIESHTCRDIYSEKYKLIIDLLTDEQDILVIDPVSSNINSRIKFIQRFNNIPRLIESIDDKEFYKLSTSADQITGTNVVAKLVALSQTLFNSGGVTSWFNDQGAKKKRKPADQKLLLPIVEKIKLLENRIAFSSIADVLKEIHALPGVKCYRRDLFNSFCRALEEAEFQKSTVLDAMIARRNAIRRRGRKIFGKCVGTTLLTKGLEFNTVLVINAQLFESPKHFYVAITRASRRLIVLADNPVLKPYKQED